MFIKGCLTKWGGELVFLSGEQIWKQNSSKKNRAYIDFFKKIL